MKIGAKALAILFLLIVLPRLSSAQCTDSTSPCQVFPRFVKFSGVLKNSAGSPLRGLLAIKFVVYSDSTGGTPLWQETQNTELDQSGRYEVLLGSTGSEGVPMELFTTGEPRWLGVQALIPGRDEEPRILLSSVPYALQSANAQTLGGLPASAFAKVNPSVLSEPTQGTATAIANPVPLSATGTALNSSASASSAAGRSSAIEGRVGPINIVPKFSGGGLASSQITDAGGTVSMQNLSNILFADRFPGGVPDAVAACPEIGCVISAVSPTVNLNLGSIDPGSKAITIYLGPYTYTVKQITLRMSLKIIGMGASGGAAGSATCDVARACSGTILQSINGNNPVFVLPQTNNRPATNVALSGFRVYGSAGNQSEDAFFLDCSSTLNTGLRNSTFDDISISGFAGIGIHIKGRNNDFESASQWILFNNVVVMRVQGGGNALRLEGAIFELRFKNCQFDGQVMGDGTNIYIGGLPGGLSGYPISIVFEGLVSQEAALAVQIDGGVNLIFYGSHHEALWAGYQITNNTNIGTHGLTITDSYFAGNVGINGGSGYELKVATTLASGIFFVHNQLFGTPDAAVLSTNFASIVYQDNLACETCTGPLTTGITTAMSPAASINIRGVHSVALNPSVTPITTIQSSLGPGEMVTLFTFSGPVTFGAGGNINLMGQPTLTINGSITFIRNDLAGLQWIPVSQWSPTPSTTPSPKT